MDILFLEEMNRTAAKINVTKKTNAIVVKIIFFKNRFLIFDVNLNNIIILCIDKDLLCLIICLM